MTWIFIERQSELQIHNSNRDYSSTGLYLHPETLDFYLLLVTIGLSSAPAVAPGEQSRKAFRFAVFPVFCLSGVCAVKLFDSVLNRVNSVAVFPSRLQDEQTQSVKPEG